MTQIYFDQDSQVAYYLAFDLLLAATPVVDGVAVRGGRAVTPDPDDVAGQAKLAGIRALLLERYSGMGAEYQREQERSEVLMARLGSTPRRFRHVRT